MKTNFPLTMTATFAVGITTFIQNIYRWFLVFYRISGCCSFSSVPWIEQFYTTAPKFISRLIPFMSLVTIKYCLLSRQQLLLSHTNADNYHQQLNWLQHLLLSRRPIVRVIKLKRIVRSSGRTPEYDRRCVKIYHHEQTNVTIRFHSIHNFNSLSLLLFFPKLENMRVAEH